MAEKLKALIDYISLIDFQLFKYLQLGKKSHSACSPIKKTWFLPSEFAYFREVAKGEV